MANEMRRVNTCGIIKFTLIAYKKKHIYSFDVVVFMLTDHIYCYIKKRLHYWTKIHKREMKKKLEENRNGRQSFVQVRWKRMLN